MSYSHAKSLDNIKDSDVVIELKNVTKDYGKGRGIFDISFKVPKGKIFGYCGTNGAGKTTTLRHIMGFIKPDKGSITVKGMDAWKDSIKIKPFMGYLPGEIGFPPLDNGSQFLKLQAEMAGLNDMSKAEKIINAMQLDPTANLKRMSKGMKQKTAIVAAFMASPEIIILDEPTTGLDPLMREAFVNIIKEEKARGATILMSNHMFDELEETCDYVAFIKEGKIIDIVDMSELKNRPYREYSIKFVTKNDYVEFDKTKFEILSTDANKNKYTIRVPIEKTNDLFDELRKHTVSSIKEIQYNLEQYFLEHVTGGKY